MNYTYANYKNFRIEIFFHFQNQYDIPQLGLGRVHTM
jgi:hypothetical protein